jgi:hypothetical protein
MIAATLEGVTQRREREHNERAWHAWHVAALPRAKRFPKLDTMLVKPRRRRGKQQSVADMMATCRLITLAAGGKVVAA